MKDRILFGKITFIVIMLMFISNIPAQDVSEAITLGERITLHSKVLDEERTLLIYTPNGYSESKDKYPVIYLLDGTANFLHTSGIVQFLTANRRMPASIIVAINNTQRTRDLTPPFINEQSDKNAPRFGEGGGADNFFEFIKTELIPQIDKKYRTQNYKTLIGHSFGGLFAVHTLLTHPGTFNSYIAISPSLWWDNASVKEKAEKYFKSDFKQDVFLYMTLGNEDQRMQTPINTFQNILMEKAPENFLWTYKRDVNEDHGSIPHRSTYDGLELIHKGWNIPNIFDLITEKGFSAVDDHYKNLSKKYGYKIETPSAIVNAVGYWHMRNNRNEEAVKVLKRNVTNYPEESNSYDSLGDAYKASNKIEQARDCYKKAVELGIKTNSANLQIYKNNLSEMEKQLSLK